MTDPRTNGWVACVWIQARDQRFVGHDGKLVNGFNRARVYGARSSALRAAQRFGADISAIRSRSDDLLS